MHFYALFGSINVWSTRAVHVPIMAGMNIYLQVSSLMTFCYCYVLFHKQMIWNVVICNLTIFYSFTIFRLPCASVAMKSTTSICFVLKLDNSFNFHLSDTCTCIIYHITNANKINAFIYDNQGQPCTAIGIRGVRTPRRAVFTAIGNWTPVTTQNIRKNTDRGGHC